MRVIRWISIVLTLCVLAACGGGGGGGSSNGPSSQPTFTVATTTVAFSAPMDGATPPAQTVSGSIVNASANVFLFVLHTDNGIASASVQLTGETTGQLTLDRHHHGARLLR